MGVLQIPQDVVVDVIGQVGTHHVGVLHGAELGQPQAEGVAHRLVHGGGVGDAVLHDGDGLTPQGVLHAVGDEAGHVLFAQHGLLAHGAQHLHHRLGHLVAGGVGLDHLHQGDQVAGVPEVSAHKALTVLELGGDLAGAHDRGVGAEDGVGAAARLQLGEGLPLDLHVLEDGLDHQIGVLHQIAVDVIGKGDAGEAVAQLLLGDDALVQKLLGVGADARLHISGVQVVHAHLEAGVGRKHIADVLAHHARAADENVLDFFHAARLPSRLSRSGNRRSSRSWRQ